VGPATAEVPVRKWVHIMETNLGIKIIIREDPHDQEFYQGKMSCSHPTDSVYAEGLPKSSRLTIFYEPQPNVRTEIGSKKGKPLMFDFLDLLLTNGNPIFLSLTVHVTSGLQPQDYHLCPRRLRTWEAKQIDRVIWPVPVIVCENRGSEP
jgi:hypothetical protein